jgi:hypothetical protein
MADQAEDIPFPVAMVGADQDPTALPGTMEADVGMATEIGTMETGAAEIGTAEIGTAETGAAEIGTAEIGTATGGIIMIMTDFRSDSFRTGILDGVTMIMATPTTATATIIGMIIRITPRAPIVRRAGALTRLFKIR